MKSPKTTLAGILGGGSIFVDAIVDAARNSAFDHKTIGQAILGLIIVCMGTWAKDQTTKSIILIAIACCLMPSGSHAQGLLSRLPRPVPAKYVPSNTRGFFKATPTSLQVDSVFQGLRIGGPSIMVALPDFTLYTGVGVEWQHDTYSVSSGRWYKDYGVGADFFGGSQLVPGNIREVVSVGAHLSLLDGFLTVGFIYNLTTRRVQGATGPMSQLFNNN